MTLDAVDRELTEILKNIRESEERYEKEKEKAKLREHQVRANKPVQDVTTTISAQTPAHQSRTQTSGQQIRIGKPKGSTLTPTPYNTTTVQWE